MKNLPKKKDSINKSKNSLDKYNQFFHYMKNGLADSLYDLQKIVFKFRQ